MYMLHEGQWLVDLSLDVPHLWTSDTSLIFSRVFVGKVELEERLLERKIARQQGIM